MPLTRPQPVPPLPIISRRLEDRHGNDLGELAQRFQFFRQHSMPCSGNDWTMKATTEAVPCREEACAVCAAKDWLENRTEMYLFQEASGTTTWAKQVYAIDDGSDGERYESCDRARDKGGSRHEHRHAEQCRSDFDEFSVGALLWRGIIGLRLRSKVDQVLRGGVGEGGGSSLPNLWV